MTVAWAYSNANRVKVNCYGFAAGVRPSSLRKMVGDAFAQVPNYDVHKKAATRTAIQKYKVMRKQNHSHEVSVRAANEAAEHHIGRLVVKEVKKTFELRFAGNVPALQIVHSDEEKASFDRHPAWEYLDIPKDEQKTYKFAIMNAFKVDFDEAGQVTNVRSDFHFAREVGPFYQIEPEMRKIPPINGAKWLHKGGATEVKSTDSDGNPLVDLCKQAAEDKMRIGNDDVYYRCSAITNMLRPMIRRAMMTAFKATDQLKRFKNYEDLVPAILDTSPMGIKPLALQLHENKKSIAQLAFHKQLERDYRKEHMVAKQLATHL